jgi:predicted DNA-binding protein (MmcQ/YjbR family)
MGESDAIERVRGVCRALPEVEEKPFGGHTAPSFRVRDKLFVMTSEDGGSMTFKAGPGVQDELVAAAPDRFFVPPYVGAKGWVGARLDTDQDWDELAELMEDSYRMIAPKRLVAKLDQERPGS